MPRLIDPKVKERCVQQMLEHVSEYPNPTAAADAIGKRNSVGGETVRRCYVQALIDRPRATTSRPTAPGSPACQDCLCGGARPPRPWIVAFIDECRQEGYAVESICRVLSEQGCQIAARTYRAWTSTSQHVADRTISDAIVEDAVRDAASTPMAHWQGAPADAGGALRAAEDDRPHPTVPAGGVAQVR